MTRGIASPKRRLNIELAARSRERLEKLRVTTEADSMTEVIRRALILYEELHQARTDGAAILLRFGDIERELIIT